MGFEKEYKTLLTEKNGKILKVIFNNPSKLNALTDEFLHEYGEVLEEIEKDDEITVVILTGAGKAFIAGADIKLMKDMTPQEAARYAADTTVLHRRMESMDKIFIAAVNGYALGGGFEMALACDLRIASQKAKFGLPEVSLGIFPAGGGTQRLPRLIGMTKAKELIYTAKVIKAEEAMQLGILNLLTEPEELMAEAEKLALQIARNSRYALGRSKASVNGGANMELETAISTDKNLFALCFASSEQKEGMTAFIEGREPRF